MLLSWFRDFMLGWYMYVLCWLNCTIPHQKQPCWENVPKKEWFGLIQLYQRLAHWQVSRSMGRQVGTLIKHYCCNNGNNNYPLIYMNTQIIKVLSCQSDNLYNSILIQFPTCTSADLSTCKSARWIQVPPFIYWTFMHHSSAGVPNCWPAYLFPCILFQFSTDSGADLTTCQMNRGSPVHPLIFSASS